MYPKQDCIEFLIDGVWVSVAFKNVIAELSRTHSGESVRSLTLHFQDFAAPEGDDADDIFWCCAVIISVFGEKYFRDGVFSIPETRIPDVKSEAESDFEFLFYRYEKHGSYSDLNFQVAPDGLGHSRLLMSGVANIFDEKLRFRLAFTIQSNTFSAGDETKTT